MKIVVGPFGMQSPHPCRRPSADLYRDLIEHAQAAEELGFDGIALTEHSFWYDGYCPSLLPALAAIAPHTDRLGLMTGALLLPQHDPLEVAQEAAVVHNLSGGRLLLGLGAGYRPEEFLGHGVPQGRWGARFIEGFEVVRRALTRERFSFEGEFYRYDDVALPVLPHPAPPPMWVCAGFADWAPRASGRRGWAFCTTGTPGASDNILFDAYRAAADTAGVEPSVLRRGLFKDVMVMPSELEARALLEEDYWAAMADQFIGFGFLRMEDENGRQVTEVPDIVREMMMNSPTMLWGTPPKVRAMMTPLVDLGLDLLLVRTAWANFDPQRALRTMRCFAEEVMPALREAARRRASAAVPPEGTEQGVGGSA